MISHDYRQSHLQKGADYDAALNDGSFNAYMTAREAILLPQIVRRLFPARPPKYLDFACGTGRITSLVAPLARESYGVDVSASMISEAVRKSPQTRFCVQDLTSSSLDDQDFELATAFRFFGNAQPELRQSVMKAVARHLSPGGYFVFNNHRNRGSWHAKLQRAVGRYEDIADLDYQGIQQLLTNAGFSIVGTVGIAWWLMMHRLDSPRVFKSPLTRLIEPISEWPAVAPCCPACIIIAQRTGEISAP